MIYDSQEQKLFIQEAVRKYPCNYEQALQLANTFGQSIQSGRVIDAKTQVNQLPPDKYPDQQAQAQAGQAAAKPEPVPSANDQKENQKGNTING